MSDEPPSRLRPLWLCRRVISRVLADPHTVVPGLIRGTMKLLVEEIRLLETRIGKAEPEVPLADSSDGIVPYRSAHLVGATSERVIGSEHSVQENPMAILEIRRILREQLR